MNTKILLLVVIIAAVFGYGGYWLSGENNKKIISDLKTQYDSEIEDWKNQIKKLEEDAICEVEKIKEEAVSPAIRFIPNTFSESEKEELMKKVVDPFIDFEKDSGVGNEVISIAINKYSDSELAKQQGPKYTYRIDVIYKEGWGGWLEREIGDPIDYWVPDCLDGCEFSDDFKVKYPEVVEKYNAKQNPAE